MTRSAQPLPIELSDDVSKLIEREPGGIDGARKVLRQYETAGFTRIALDPAGGRLLLSAPRYRLGCKLDATESAPVTAALANAIARVRALDNYTRFRWAAYDMHGVATAARAIAPYRPDESGTFPDENPFGEVERAIVAGIVTLYTRPFTGRAMLGQKWEPTDEDELGLHRGLLEARGHIFVHADHTAYRALFDPPGPERAPTGEPPALIEMQIVAEVMLKIAAMAERQHARFEAEAARLYAEFKGVLVPTGTQSIVFDEEQSAGSLV